MSATRTRCPPDRVAGSRSANPSSPASASASATRARRAARPPTTGSSPKATFAPTERCGKRRSSWNMRPMPRRSGDRVVTSRPPTNTRPLVENARSIWPPMKLRSADFPAPLGPITVAASPGLTRNVRLSTSRREPMSTVARSIMRPGSLIGRRAPGACRAGFGARPAPWRRRRRERASARGQQWPRASGRRRRPGRAPRSSASRPARRRRTGSKDTAPRRPKPRSRRRAPGEAHQDWKLHAEQGREPARAERPGRAGVTRIEGRPGSGERQEDVGKDEQHVRPGDGEKGPVDPQGRKQRLELRTERRAAAAATAGRTGCGSRVDRRSSPSRQPIASASAAVVERSRGWMLIRKATRSPATTIRAAAASQKLRWPGALICERIVAPKVPPSETCREPHEPIRRGRYQGGLDRAVEPREDPCAENNQQKPHDGFERLAARQGSAPPSGERRA